MKRFFPPTALAAALLTLPHADAVENDAIVVTATRTASRVNAVLSDVTLVDRADIERSVAADLPGLLATLPGISLTRAGGVGASTSLFIRGTNSNHALVLIDGQRVSSATLGTTAIEHLPLAQIERIEVVRGPASSLYGADAIGGVIQIFTRSAAGPAKPEFTLGAGRYGTTTGSAGLGGESGDTRFQLLAGWDDSRGFSSAKAPTGSFTDIFNPDRDAYRNRHLSARLSQRLGSAAEVGARVFGARTRKHFDGANCDAFFTLCTADFDNRQQQDLSSFSAYLDAQASANWKTSLQVGRSEDDSRSLMLDPVALQVIEDRFRTTQDQLSWQNDFTTELGKLMAAIDWRQEKVDSTKSFVVSARTTRAAVLGYQGRFGDHELQASGRLDDISRFGTHRSGSFAYGYRFTPGWRAHASLGRAFHAPTFNDLYWPVDPINFYQGNPHLKPERAFNREVGVEFNGANSVASLVAYRNHVSDLLDFAVGQAPTFIGQFENLASATLKGVTASYGLYAGAWTVRAHADVLSARDERSHLFLQRRAPRSGGLDVRRQFDAFDVGVQLTAVSRRFNDARNTQTLGGYGLVDVDAAYRLSPEWTLQAKLGNLFDKNYVLVRESFSGNDYATPGRSLFVGVKYAPK